MDNRTHDQIGAAIQSLKTETPCYKIVIEGDEENALYLEYEQIQDYFLDPFLTKLDILGTDKDQEVIFSRISLMGMIEEIQAYIVDLYEKEGYSGIDKSLEISLFEHNLITKEVNGNIKYVHQVGEKYITGSISIEEINEKIEEDWFDKKGFFGFLGVTQKEWLKGHAGSKLSDLLSYQNRVDILGEDYNLLSLLDLKI